MITYFLFYNYSCHVGINSSFVYKYLPIHHHSVQFSRSVMSDSLQPHELQHARPPCPSPTPGVHSDSCPSSQRCHPAISSSVVPFSSSPLATSCEELTHWKRLWCWEELGAGGKGDDRGWDGWMASLTRRTWVWVNSRSWWWTGRPGML